MKSHQKSLAQGWLVKFLVVFTVATAGCSSKRRNVQVDTGVPEEVSLRADREKFKNMRKDIPVDQQKYNDELATILESMNRPEENPSKVRDRFNSLVSRNRNDFNKRMQKEREDFNQSEKDRRDKNLAAIAAERARFTGRKHTQKENQEFYAKLDGKRAKFTSEERDRRAEFDGLMREKRGNFDEHMRSISQRFNDEHRRYTQNYNEYQKAMELKKTSQKNKGFLDKNGQPLDYSRAEKTGNVESTSETPAVDPTVSESDLEAFKNIPQGTGQPLGPSDGN